ncbi:hypothetical protein RM543_04615 [Roseicyclus sp. F158]|uniref:Uncharacterized protein n=1 Tax=Tropicimonas omnivorans TaxID=3075590 RepID=A0ABU3DEH8_9RHOB|nr:hypothetical protein [Roseicyclus sp. F158]MDT0681959.1 hypothetical protein [Roseicyclus sp. F158]
MRYLLAGLALAGLSATAAPAQIAAERGELRSTDSNDTQRDEPQARAGEERETDEEREPGYRVMRISRTTEAVRDRSRVVIRPLSWSTGVFR